MDSSSRYNIRLRIYQTNPGDNNVFFRPVEKTVWNYANGGSWNQIGGEYVLHMNGSGTSGTIRLLADNGENCIIAVGVHNYKRWTDIVTNLANDQTGVIINPQYYSQKDREEQRERQLVSYQVKNAKGRQFAVNFIQPEGNDLVANVIIG
ncbi:hypothetical protein H0H92_005946 [Tricholoma furcatifolium]|nr:hypothetical protein H0H92_005946 [Tricholoma furcatifolium]